MPDELCFLSIAELARLYRAKDASPVEVTDAVLEQIDMLQIGRIRAAAGSVGAESVQHMQWVEA